MSIDYPSETFPEAAGPILLEPSIQSIGNDGTDTYCSHETKYEKVLFGQQTSEDFEGCLNRGVISTAFEGHANLSCLLFIYIMYKIKSRVE